MTTLMRGGFGGEVRQTGARRLEADYPHRFVTAMLALPVLFFSAATLFNFVGAVVTREPALLLPGVLGGALGGFLAVRLRQRVRSMGRFVLDLERDELVRWWGPREVDRRAAADITGVAAQWDPFHRGLERHFWLVVETRDGRRYRLGKATREEVDETLARLRSWGLPG